MIKEKYIQEAALNQLRLKIDINLLPIFSAKSNYKNIYNESPFKIITKEKNRKWYFVFKIVLETQG